MNSLPDELIEIKAELAQIKERNNKVSLDKAWEISLCRKLSILTLTYIVALITMCLIGVKEAYLSALIPVIGYYLSTLSLPFIRKIWLKSKAEQNNGSN